MKVLKSERVIALAVVAVALILLAIGLIKATADPPPLIEGNIDATRIDVASKVPGRVATVYVQVGQRVHQGQPLFKINSPETQQAIAAALGSELAARGALLSAKGSGASAAGAAESAMAVHLRAVQGPRAQDIAAVRAQWQRAVSAARLASLTYVRTRALYRENVATRQQRDDAFTAMQTTQQQERSSYNIYRAEASGTRPEDVAAAAGQLRSAEGEEMASTGAARSAEGAAQQAQAALALARAEQAETVIASPADGEVDVVDTHAGELAPQGYPVVSLVEVNDVWATFDVLENQLQRFKEGTEIKGRVPALNGAVLRFRVYYQAPLGQFATETSSRTTTGEDLRTFEIRARPLERTRELRRGMSVTVVN